MGNNANKTPIHSLKEQLNANSIAYRFKQVYRQAKQMPKAKTKKQPNRNLQIKTHRIHRYDENSKPIQNSKQFSKLSTPLQISPISSIKTSRNMNANLNHNLNLNNTNTDLNPLHINRLHTQKQPSSLWWLSFREKLSHGTTLVCPAPDEKYLVHYLIFNSFAEYEHFTDTVIYRIKALHSCHKARKYLNPISAIYGEKVQTIQCGCGDTGQNDGFCQQYRVYIVENYMHQCLDSFLENYSLSYSHLLGILYSFVVVMAAYQYKRLRFGSIDFYHVFIQKIKQHKKNNRNQSALLNMSQIQQYKHRNSTTNEQIRFPQKLEYICKVSDPYIKDFINQSQSQLQNLQNGRKSSETSTSPLNADIYKNNVLEVGKIVEEYLSFKSIHKDFINTSGENAEQEIRAQAVLQRLVRNHMICNNRSQKDQMANKNQQNYERYNWLQIQRYLQQEYYNKSNHNGKYLKKATKQMQFYSINSIKPPSTPHGNHTTLYSIPGPNPSIVYNPTRNHEYHSVDARLKNVQYKARSLEKQPTGNSLKHLHQPINGTHFNVYSQQPTQSVLGQKVQENVLKILNGKKTSRVNIHNNKTNGSFNKQNMPNIRNTMPTNTYINLKPSRRNDTKNSQTLSNQAVPQNQPPNINININPATKSNQPMPMPIPMPMAISMPTCSNSPTLPPLQNNINIQNLNIQTTNYSQNQHHNQNQSSAHHSNNNNNTNANNNGGSNSKNSSANKYLNYHNTATNQHIATSFVHTLNTLNSEPMSVLYNQRDVNVISNNNRERLAAIQPVTPQNSGYGVIENPTPEQPPQSTKIQYKNLYNIGKYWSKFQGNFHNGCKEGPGTIYLTNGHIFNGYFQADVANGRGEVYVDGQAVVRGYWRNNLFVTQY